MEDIKNNIGCKVGCVAKCHKGRLGVIMKVYWHYPSMHSKDKEKIYQGVGLDGKNWQSTQPIFIANNVNDYIASLKS